MVGRTGSVLRSVPLSSRLLLSSLPAHDQNQESARIPYLKRTVEDTHLSFLLMSAKGIGAGAFLGACGLLMARLLVFLTTGATSSSLSSSLVSFLTTFLFFLSAFRSARDSSCSSSSPPTVFCRPKERRSAKEGTSQSKLVSKGARRATYTECSSLLGVGGEPDSRLGLIVVLRALLVRVLRARLLGRVIVALLPVETTPPRHGKSQHPSLQTRDQEAKDGPLVEGVLALDGDGVPAEVAASSSLDLELSASSATCWGSLRRE